MTYLEPKVVDSGKYPVGATAVLLGIDRSTLYKHTQEGKIRCGINRCNHRRFYTGREIKRYWQSQI